MDTQFFKSSFEILEANKERDLFLVCGLHEGEEGYLVLDKSEIDIERDGYTRLNNTALAEIERGERKISVYESKEIEEAQLEFEHRRIDKEIKANPETSLELKKALEEYAKYLTEVKEGVGGDDWRTAAMPKDEFVDERVKQIQKEAALERIANYQVDKSYEKSTPYCLRDKALFVGWKYVWSDKANKVIKIPISPKTGHAADTTNFHDWTNFERACQAVKKFDLHGIGIVFNARGLMGIDIDDCMKDGKLIDPKAREIVDTVNSYTEISPSGNGIHILCYGRLPDEYGYKRKDSLEMYDTGRFFTLTGKVLEGHFRKIPPQATTQKAVTEIWRKYLRREKAATLEIDNVLTLDDDDLIFKISKSKRANDFKRMFEQGLPPIDDKGEIIKGCRKNRDKPGTMDNVDWSKVDLCLCGMLAFYNPPKKQVDRIFRASKLMRGKWDEMRGDISYGQKTIDYAYNTRQVAYSNDVARSRAIEYKQIKRFRDKDDIMQ